MTKRYSITEDKWGDYVLFEAYEELEKRVDDLEEENRELQGERDRLQDRVNELSDKVDELEEQSFVLNGLRE